MLTKVRWSLVALMMIMSGAFSIAKAADDMVESFDAA